MTLSSTSIAKLYGKLKAEKHLVIVPGATHLFEEPGTLQEVARLAADWFRRHLRSGPGVASRRQLQEKVATPARATGIKPLAWGG